MPNSAALQAAGADGGSGGSRGPGEGFLLQSTCSPPSGTPHPPRYSCPARSHPASPYLSVRKDVMATRRRSAQGDGSSPRAGREPAQHEQDASHPQAAAPAASRPWSRAARSSRPSGRHLRAGVVTMECDASPPPPALAADRWRAVSRLAIGGHHAGPAEDEGSGDRGDARSWPISGAGQPT